MRELPVDDQLIFVTGYRPMRVKKLRYYVQPTFVKGRAAPAGPVAGLGSSRQARDRVARGNAPRAGTAGAGVQIGESGQPLFDADDGAGDDEDDDEIREAEPQ